MPSPFVCMKIFVKRFFLKHHSVLQWIFLVQSDKKFSTEKRDIRYYEKKISIPQIFWNIEGMPRKIFGTVRPEIFGGKTWYPQICIKFFATPNFLKHSREAREIFGTVRPKFFNGKRDTPPPFHPQNFSKPEVFWKTVWLPYEIFRHCETYKFRLKIVICPLLSINFFRYQKLPGKQKGSFTKSFVSVLWDKKYGQNCDAPPLICMKIFEKRILLTHQIVQQWKILVQSDKKISTENCDNPYYS